MTRESAWRTSAMKLRSHLLVLVAASVLPLLLFVAIGSALFVRYERQTFQRGATERTLALITAVDAELRGAVATLQALAALPALERRDLADFQIAARRVLESQPDWFTIHLAVPSGQQVVDVLKPYGSPLAMIQERGSFDQVVTTSEPAISGLAVGQLGDVAGFAVRVPVVQDHRVAYVLSGVLSPKVIDRLLAAQRLPANWVGVVVDGDNRILSRTVKPEQTVGALASESLRAALARGSEGWFRGSTIEGTPVYTPFNRSSFSGWTVAMGIPAPAVDAAFWRTTSSLVGGVLGALATAWLVAFWLARRLTAPVDALASAARALGRGERVTIPVNTRIAEVGDLGLALQGAAAAVQAREEVQQRAEEALRAADRAKDEFLAMLGHELRNPLGAIAGARALLDVIGGADERAAAARAVIGRQVQHLSRLVDDLLDVSRVSSGKIVLRPEPLDLAAHVTAVMAGWRTAGRFAHYEVTLDATPVWVTADAARVEQILDNLVGNALKYTPPGGHVGVRVSADGSSAVLSVTDTGSGMPAALLDRVFEPFVQGERSADRAQGGLGLGLALVKALVVQHGGTVRAMSAGPGHGSTLTVCLPRAEPTAAPRGESSTVSPGTSQRVLVIEDNDDARDMLTALLTMAGHEVHAAASAERGIELANTVRPDVALVDVGLPGVDGYEVARRLRAAEIGKGLRLIAITGYGQPDDRRRTEAAGFDVHLVKPVAPEEIIAIVAGAARDVGR